ncbi:MAG: protease pro-enzyme activation domain-containing protein [Gammaproteobacteria bacterium]
MSRRLFTAVLGFFVLAIFAGLAFVSDSSAAPGAMPMPLQPKTNALVRMQPQTDISLLQQATQIGQHPLGASIKLTVGMKLRHVAQLKRFLQNVQNPRSPEYHRYLTPQQFTAQYGPSQAQVALVVSFLQQHGIRVKNVSSNRMLIHTEATTDAYNHALEIVINDYRLNGRQFFSTTDRPQLPGTVANVVQSILGLDNSQLMRPHSHYRPLGLRAHGASPQATPPPATTAYFIPAQIAKAYDWPPIASTSNGAGVSIAIVTADTPGFASDTSPHTFWSSYGLPDHTITVTPVDGTATVADGLGETTLDTEYSGAMAPGATIHVYLAANPDFTTFTDAYNQFVTDGTSQVMTTSWGGAEADDPSQFETDEGIFMQGAAEGISMFAAAGDNGSDDNCTVSGCVANDNADYPSSSAYVTAANGSLLTISDVSGTYGSETAWSDTGGAISQLFARPTWQVGPGVPSTSSVPMRMNSDMALNSGENSGHFYIIYDASAGFEGVYGTSAVAPILAGLFAIGDSHQTAGPLGQSNELIYNDVNAGNYATDFHDITTGSNGAFEAGVNWDHPTGWGSPIATNFLDHIGIQGPAGTIQGTVTASASGSVLAGATVTITPGNFQLKTASDGTYATELAVGTYSVQVSDFGYQTQSQSATITDGTTTTTNFALTVAPSATLSGQITDGSGHGWPLYAEVKVSTAAFGQVADVWTNPTTGHYSVSLPTGSDYTVDAAAYENGYTAASASLTLAGAATQNLPLTVDASCTAPGYALQGFGQDFNGTTFPPTGWTVNNKISGEQVVWELTSAEPSPYNVNYTGGTGTAADADSNAAGSGGGSYDTRLITPPIPVTSLHGATTLTYKANFQPYASESFLDLDISTDGGSTWTTISHWTTAHGSVYALPGVSVTQDLSSYLPSSGDFQLRWRFYDTTGSNDYYAQIDDVFAGSCDPVAGGLAEGNVLANASGAALIGATVTADTGQSAKTFANPADPNLADGLYVLFVSPSGNHTLTATDGEYSPTPASVSIINNGIATQSFSLKTPHFTVNPTSFNVDVQVGQQLAKTLTINNTGQGAGVFKVVTVNAPPPSTAAARKVPLREIQGHFSPASVVSLEETSSRAGTQGGYAVAPAAMNPVPHDSAWTAIAAYPIPVVDSCAAADPNTGLVYSVTGISNDALVSSDYVYNPGLGTWAQIAAFPGGGLELPACAFLNGKLYVTDGADSTGASSTALNIYDPSTDSWSTGADNPNSAGIAAAVVALNGKLYVIGGCESSTCSPLSSGVEVYNPASDSWSSAAAYPSTTAFEGCAATSGKIYCAGGLTSASIDTANAYAYDPGSDSWSAIAPIPYDNWGMSAAGTSLGRFLLQDGVTDGTSTITNQGAIYDVASNSWSSLPNNIVTTYRSGSACGFYEIGGMDSAGAFAGIAASEVLPGYSVCTAPIPYLTVAPKMGTVAAGASANVTLTFDGTGQQEFTTSKGYLTVRGSPNSVLSVPITVNWEPDPMDLAISGSVSPAGTVKAGETLAYTLAVRNIQSSGSGLASQTKLTYQVPSGLTYFASSGDATSCTASASTLTCDFGTLAAGASDLETIVMQANQDADTVDSTFTVSAREPDSDPSNNTLMLSTNPNGGPAGPQGPQGPQGAQGSKGSSGFGFLGLGMLALLGMGAIAVETRKRRRHQHD